MTMRATPIGDSPLAHVTAQLWNDVHEAAYDQDIKLAILVRDPISAGTSWRPGPGPRRRVGNLTVREQRGEVIVAWVVRSRAGLRFGARQLRADDFVSLAPRLSIERVLMMRPMVSPAEKRVENALACLGFRREIDRQLTGYWFEPGEPIPSRQPDFWPEAAVLPARTAADGSRALLLVALDYIWHPLSEWGAATYTFGEALLGGEPMLLVPANAPEHPWPTPLRVRLHRVLSADELEVDYPGIPEDRRSAEKRYLELLMEPARQ